MKRFGPMDAYHERFRTYPGLRKMATGLHVHDYTFSILADSGAFAAQDVVPGPAPRLFRALPSTVLAALRPIAPTYIWIGSPSGRGTQSEVQRRPLGRDQLVERRPQRPEQGVQGRVRKLTLVLRSDAPQHRHAVGLGGREQCGLAAAGLAA